MVSRRKDEPEPKKSRRPPATTPERRERQLVSKAVDLAEKQLTEGTASAQVITHYLKLGSTREHLEKQLIAENIALQRAKRENMASAARVEELYTQAIAAMRRYAGQDTPDDDEEFDD